MKQNNDFGFIITRHVNSEKTNYYWNNCVKCIRIFYPDKKIVIIDDNSDKNYVKSFTDYINIEIIESEFPKRGELLPFIYFLKNKYFDNAIILHDSVFFHKRINFEKLNVPVIPLWHFDSKIDPEKKMDNTIRIAAHLNNSLEVIKKLKDTSDILNSLLISRIADYWDGCFGAQMYISHDFLTLINNKYKLTNLLPAITCRKDRCAFERIIGAIIFAECKELKRTKSLLGSIFTYCKWGYTYDQYINDIYSKKKVNNIIVKVWTGR